ncbi:MAG TPA: 1,4-dihydroxy-2-naphthoate polyprenyltransferase [Candidatus Dormibacteraeota bacterium]|nr:1,4-dihydroxy-2-naphthoate polyprenyltransferase [Candidatus Dormibacteraeota bacterium]
MTSAAPGGRPAPTVRQVWWHASRPATLAASVSPVLAGVGVALHAGPVRWAAAAGALVVAVAIQFGVNYANDYSDYVRGADTQDRIGPPRAAASGIVPPGQVRAAAIGAFGLAAAVGVAVSLATDWRLLLVGAACILAGWLYTGGPRPYGYHGLGEVVCFVFFGLVAVAGTADVSAGRVPAAAWPAAVALGALASAILLLNNIRDIDTDQAAGKRTLAVLVGRRRARAILFALLATPYLAVLAAWALRLAGPLLWLPWATLPVLWPVIGASGRREGLVLVGALKRTALVELAFAILLAAGLAVPG